MPDQGNKQQMGSNGSPNRTGSAGSSNNPSANASRTPSVGPEQQKQKGTHRVKFSVGGTEEDVPKKLIPTPTIRLPKEQPTNSRTATIPDPIDTDISEDVTNTPKVLLSPVEFDSENEEDELIRRRHMFSALSAQDRAQRLASLLGSNSAPGSRRNSTDSPTLSPDLSPTLSSIPSQGDRIDNIPLMQMSTTSSRPYSIYDSTDSDDEKSEKPKEVVKENVTNTAATDLATRRLRAASNAEAHQIVRAVTGGNLGLHRIPAISDGFKSGQVTPEEERDPDAYAPRPDEYKTGILSSLLKLYDHQNQVQQQQQQQPPMQMGATLNPTLSIPQNRQITPRSSRLFSYHSRKNTNDSTTPLAVAGTPGASPQSSGRNTPRRPKWYDQKSPNQSMTSLGGLLTASTMMATPASASTSQTGRKPARPGMPGRSHSGGLVSNALQKMYKPRLEDEIRITVHIAEILSRQRYLMKLCKALMMYGAPTHRLEEYMRMSARVLQIEGQFLYIPGCMIISFDDTTTHTTEVKLVRVAQGVDLGKMKDTHTIYKEVVHDTIGVEEAIRRLDDLLNAKPKFNKWILIPVYGCASAFVGPFAFGARPIDMPISFLLGCVLGFLQLVAAPASDLYSNVFEISASVITSFLARAFGSIYNPSNGVPYFCFSAMAQSAIALILPGYIILCGSLELQSKSLVAGSVRMVYAIIYALFLGFGITIGTALYGLMDKNATVSYTCPNIGGSWESNVYLSHFPWVPLFTMCLILINQAKWSQAPIMLFISFVGYQVNFWSAKRFANNVQISNALGAFAIGVVGNLYSRLRHGLAAAALLPAIFVQVPSGLAASGSLVSGITTAEQITGNITSGTSIITNGTQGFVDAASSSSNSSNTVYNIGYGMIQVAIGITVGLFLSSLVVYPFGKRRSGLFSF